MQKQKKLILLGGGGARQWHPAGSANVNHKVQFHMSEDQRLHGQNTTQSPYLGWYNINGPATPTEHENERIFVCFALKWLQNPIEK